LNSDRTLLNEKIQRRSLPNSGSAIRDLEAQTSNTNVSDTRNCIMSVTSPTHPYILVRMNARSRSFVWNIASVVRHAPTPISRHHIPRRQCSDCEGQTTLDAAGGPITEA